MCVLSTVVALHPTHPLSPVQGWAHCASLPPPASACRASVPKLAPLTEPAPQEGNTGHPVFETAFGKIGINICYGR